MKTTATQAQAEPTAAQTIEEVERSYADVVSGLARIEQELDEASRLIQRAANVGDSGAIVKLRARTEALRADMVRYGEARLELLRSQLGVQERLHQEAQAEQARIKSDADKLNEQLRALQQKRTAINEDYLRAQSAVHSSEHAVERLRRELSTLTYEVAGVPA